MATTDAVLFIRPQTNISVATGRTSGVVLYIAPRFSSGAAQSGVPASANETNLKAWLPPPRHPLVDSQGFIDPRWYRFFEYLTEKRLGGASGPSLNDIAATITTVKDQAVSDALTISGLLQQATANAESLSTTVQVIRDNSLPGASQIPPVVLSPTVTGDGGSGGGEGF